MGETRLLVCGMLYAKACFEIRKNLVILVRIPQTWHSNYNVDHESRHIYNVSFIVVKYAERKAR